MKQKTLLILAAILAILCIFAVIYKGCFSKPSERLLFANLDTDKIVKFEIVTDTGTVVFEKSNEQWQITEPFSFEADPKSIKTLLDNLGNISLKNLISTNEAKHTKFGVDQDSGKIITIYLKGRKPPVSIILGKTSALNSMHSYVRLKDEKEVYLSRGPSQYLLQKKPLDWQNKYILNIEKEDISELNLIYPDETVKLSLLANKWLLDDTSLNEEARTDEVEKLINRLPNLMANRIILSEEAAKIADKTGFDNSEFQLVVRTFDGKEYDLIVGSKVENSNNYYMKKNESGVLYTLSEYSINTIKKKSSDLRKPATEQLPEENKSE